MSERILIIDDEHSVRTFLCHALTAQGYDPFSIGDPREAIRVFQSAPVDLVLLDLGLGEVDGWDVFKELTAAKPEVPVIIMTAHTHQVSTAMSAGVGSLVEKPFNTAELIQAIEEQFNESPIMRQARLAGTRAAFHFRPALNA